jgi:VanZ family protein
LRSALRRLVDHPAGAWTLLLVYGALIFRLSSQPIGDEVELFPQADKLFHLIEYGLFGALTYHAVQVTRRDDPSRIPLLVAIGLGVAYGFSDELHQHFVPTRHMSSLDLFVNAVGTAAGAWWLEKRRRLRRVVMKSL